MCFIHGLRVSELRALRLEDIDLTSNRIHISRLKTGFPFSIRSNRENGRRCYIGWPSGRAILTQRLHGYSCRATADKYHVSSCID